VSSFSKMEVNSSERTISDKLCTKEGPGKTRHLHKMDAIVSLLSSKKRLCCLLSLVMFAMLYLLLNNFRPMVFSFLNNNETGIYNNTVVVLEDDVTIVTAYFNIGSFAKGSQSQIFTSSLYRSWMSVFSAIDNPVIAYFDNDLDLQYFRLLRNRQFSARTKLVKVLRSELWAFSLQPNISRIFKQANYPQHTPNTVVPEYSAAMHAKYEVMQMAIGENPFRTKYFCWLDIGLFRNLAREATSNSKLTFSLYLPPDFQNSSVAYDEVGGRNGKLSMKEIVYRNEVWVCGCFFVAQWDVMLNWTMEYKNATERMIQSNIMSTDQQVIYSMFNHMSPTTTLQLYKPDGRYDPWFHLGYLSRDAGYAKKRLKPK